MPAAPLVRPREDRDAEALVAALAQVHETDAYPLLGAHVTRDWLYDGFDAAWVVEVRGEVMGHVSVGSGFALPSGGEALGLSRLFVGPATRGSGGGHALLAAAEAHARQRGLPLALEVLDHNLGAVRLYESRGWQRIGERDVDWFGPAGPYPHAFVYAGPRSGVEVSPS